MPDPIDVHEAMRWLCLGLAGISTGTRNALATLVSTRVYLNQADNGAVDPKIVIKLVSRPETYSHQGDSNLSNPRYQLDCYAATDVAAKALAKAVRENISGFRGTVGANVIVGAVFVENGHSFTNPSPGASQNAERGYSLDAVLWSSEQ